MDEAGASEFEELTEFEDFGCSISVEELLKESSIKIGSPASGGCSMSSEELLKASSIDEELGTSASEEELELGP